MSETTTTTQDCGCGAKTVDVKPTVLTRVLNKVFVPEAEKNRRMEICKSCDHFNDTFAQCKICGCFLEAKTR